MGKRGMRACGAGVPGLSFSQAVRLSRSRPLGMRWGGEGSDVGAETATQKRSSPTRGG